MLKKKEFMKKTLTYLIIYSFYFIIFLYQFWALHPATITSRATGKILSFLVYRAEACLPLETLMGSPWVHYFDESMQEPLRREDVDFTDERRRQAMIRNARYNQALRHYHQLFVHSRELGAGT
jgi:hypothetical protein